MNAKILCFMLLLCGLLLSGCAPAATAVPPQSAASTSNGGADTPLPAEATIVPGPTDNPTDATQRLVIKNASLEIVVDNPDQAVRTIMDMAQAMGGFVVNSSTFKVNGSSGTEVPQAKITVRVPAQRLDEALKGIHALVKNAVTDISNENITGQDVTDSYVDLNSRLINLQAAEKQLQQILQTQTKTDDALAVFRELTNIRQQIETTLGKMKFYEQSSSLSSIDVEIRATDSIAPIAIGGWEPVGIMRDAVQSLIEAGKFLATMLIWGIVFVLPIGLIIFFPVRFLHKKLSKLSNKPIQDQPKV